MLIPHWLIGVAIFAGLAAFIGFAFRQELRVKPDRDKDSDEWTRSAGGGPPSDDSSHSANRRAEGAWPPGTGSEVDEYDRPNGGLAGQADPAILAPMPKLRPAIRYGIDALLILIPLLGMTYFLFDPEAFNAFLAWLARIL
jgi:hypothetical protein